MPHLESEQNNIRQPETREGNDKIVLEIQTELLRRAGCAPEDNEKCQNWIDAYAATFRKLTETEPAILEQWQNDREAALREIENRLYTKEERESIA